MVWYGTIPTESFSNNESSFVKVPLLEDDILELFNMIVDENYRPHALGLQRGATLLQNTSSSGEDAFRRRTRGGNSEVATSEPCMERID